MATDKLFYKLAIHHPAAILKLLGIPDSEKYTASSFTFKAMENRRDLVFIKRSGKEVLFVESHGYADSYVYHGLLDGIMLYCRHKQFQGYFRAAVIFLEKSHHQAALKLAHHFDGHAGLAFRPIVLVMNQIDLVELEKLNDVRLIPLYPLCKISSRKIEASVPVWAKRIKRANKTAAERADLLTLLGGFATHRVKRLTLGMFNQLVGGFKMEDTRIGKELIQIGVQQGMHRLLLQQIAQRFGPVPVTLRRQIEKITDARQLERIAGGLLKANDLKQLQQFIGPNGKATSHARKGLKAKRNTLASHGVSR